ncbi:MAG: hypothetical protein R3A45_08625 [Bdellovibrionota bacterium]
MDGYVYDRPQVRKEGKITSIDFHFTSRTFPLGITTFVTNFDRVFESVEKGARQFAFMGSPVFDTQGHLQGIVIASLENQRVQYVLPKAYFIEAIRQLQNDQMYTENTLLLYYEAFERQILQEIYRDSAKRLTACKHWLQVQQSSPSHQEIQPSEIILSINNVPICSQLDFFEQTFNTSNQEVVLELMDTSGRVKTISTKVVPYPSMYFTEYLQADGAIFHSIPLSHQLIRQKWSGVYITSKKPGTTFRFDGANTLLLTQIQDYPIHHIDDVKNALSTLDHGNPILLRYNYVGIDEFRTVTYKKSPYPMELWKWNPETSTWNNELKD